MDKEFTTDAEIEDETDEQEDEEDSPVERIMARARAAPGPKKLTDKERLQIEKQRQTDHMIELLGRVLEECPKAGTWYLDKIKAIYMYLLRVEGREPSKHSYIVKGA
jgi:hypothetical protein